MLRRFRHTFGIVYCAAILLAATQTDVARAAAQTAAAPKSSGSSSRSTESNAWWSEPLNTVLDKGLLAVVLVVVTSRLNEALERSKSEESLSSGLTDIRLKKVGEMSEAAYAWESEVVESVEQLRREVVKYPSANQSAIVQNFLADRKRLAEQGRDCLSVLARNRFWVGDALYSSFATFYRRVSDALENIVDVASLDEFRTVLKETHVNATDAMKIFINDHVRMRALWTAPASQKR